MGLSNRLTKSIVERLKPTDKDEWYRDGDGLAIRVYPNGAKVWYYIYTNNQRKKRYKRLGAYPELDLKEARNLRDETRQFVQKGIDPLEEERREAEEYSKAMTVSELVGMYIEKHAKPNKRKSWHEDERIHNKDIIPVWGERKAIDIKRQDVTNLLDSMRPRGDAITLNTYKIVRKMFKYAVNSDIIDRSPCEGLTSKESIPVVASRERVLDDEEIKILWQGLAKASMAEETRKILKIILLTCQRPGEVASMHRSEIKGTWWEFTPKKTNITEKTPRKQRIYLTDTVLQLIGDADGYIFSSPVDGKQAKSRHTSKNSGSSVQTEVAMNTDQHVRERSVAYAIRKNLKGYKRIRPAKDPDAGDTPKMVKVREDRKLELAHFTPHDLRRTGATILSKLGFADEVIDSILAHLKQGTIKIYNRHDYDEQKQEALTALETHIMRLIEVPQKPRPLYWLSPGGGTKHRIIYNDTGEQIGLDPPYYPPSRRG